MCAETKLERIKRLEDACNTLKSEFVGIDNIIDELKTAITPWYVTPEVIERPVVVSLWGMTGTGKTSVIHRLTELLDISKQSLFFDCGSENKSDGDDLSEVLRDFITADNDAENPIRKTDVKSFALVFDEFQYARTLNEQGEEVDKPNLRPIWNLLDNGILNINRISRYDLGYLNDFVEDLSAFALEHGDIVVKNNTIENKDDVKLILSALGYFYYNRGVPDIMGPCSSYGYDSSFDVVEENDMFEPIRVVEDRLLRIIYRKSGNVGKRPREIEDILACTTINEIVDLLKKFRTNFNVAEEINCSKSIVFIVGNLDEAFRVSNDIDPDMDADVFYDETAKVTDSDIKDALKSRFRAEQIARFGNSIIKYPSLPKNGFKEIIKKEVGRICDKFKSEDGVTLEISQSFLDLLYSEGVYPVQGVRPVFTTIGTIFTPLLSNILIKKANSSVEIGNVYIDVENPESGYKVDSKDISINYPNINEKDVITISLSLGRERNPKNRKTAYICSVHETGHAIMMSYLTGKLPLSIVSVATDRGGFCVTHDKDKLGEIDTKRDIANSVMIGLGGYEAEQLIFKNKPDMTLLGSGSDIETNWRDFSESVYESGYFDPYVYSNLETESGSGGPAGGFRDDEVYKKIKQEFEIFREKTQAILSSNKTLLVKTALILGEQGEISGSKFKELIEKYGNTLTIEKMEESLKENSKDWYKEVLLDLDE